MGTPNETVRLEIRIQRRDGPDIPLDAEVNPVHADWLWNLFDVPIDERNNMVLTIPISAVQLLRQYTQTGG